MTHITSQTYDNIGNVNAKTDGENNITQYGYDEYNRLITVTNAKAETTSYTYDLNGNMLTQTTGGNTLTYEYNAAGKPVRKIDAGGRTGTLGNYSYNPAKTESYTYYADGSLKTKTDRNGETSNYTYDIFGRLIDLAVGDIDITYTYDANGNQLTVEDETGTTTRIYDALNRVTTKTVPHIGTSAYDYDITLGMDQGCYGERTTDPKGNVTLKVYDKLGRLSAVTSGSDTTSYAYYPNGSQESVIYGNGNGIKEEYTYYSDNLLQSLTNKNSDGTVIDSYSYTYDSAHNQLTKVDSKGTTSYEYDQLNRLQEVTEPGGKITTYTYDTAGNRETETIVNGNNTTLNTYTYNEQNRLMDITTKVNGVQTNDTTYTYDNNGNQMITMVNGVTSLSNGYNEINQLISTVNGTNTLLYEYNAEGYRVEKSIDGTITRYLYEADKVILEVNGAGTQVGSNVYGLNLLKRSVDGATYSYLYNGHADVTALVGTNSSTAATYYYDAFGTIIEQTGSIDNSITYGGYQYDKETGLYYLNARYYDSITARFLSEDTFIGDPNDPLSLNLYTYCYNNPLIYIDPTGHWVKGDEGLNSEAEAKVIAIGNAWAVATTQEEKDKLNAEAERIRKNPDSWIQKDTLVELPKEGLFDFFMTAAMADNKLTTEESNYAMSIIGATTKTSSTVDTTTYNSLNVSTTTSITTIGKADIGVSTSVLFNKQTNNLAAVQPVDINITTHYSAYVFYNPRWQDQAEQNIDYLASYYGIDKTDIGTTEIGTDSNPNNGNDGHEFLDAWNSIGSASNGNNVSAVVIFNHGGTGGLEAINNSQIQQLESKNIDNLLLPNCNAGHLDYVGNNPASFFAEKISGGKVMASDGTLSSDLNHKLVFNCINNR